MHHTRTCQRVATHGSTAAFAACLTRLAALPLSFSDSPAQSHGLLRRCGGAAGNALASCRTKRVLSAVYCSCATKKSRSLAPDDPFGEKSSWEDPSDGLYSAWKDVDLDGFVNATQSEEVRNAHFGPEWARFTTVGRLSVKKMKESEAVQPHPTPSATSSSTGSAATADAEGAAKHYPTAEEMHEKELLAKRRLLERNYTSYEAFVEHELGAGEGFSEEAAETSMKHPAGPPSELYSAASMEKAFSAVDGLDGRDRMAQRNVEREALDTIEAAEVEEVVALPNFIYEKDTRMATPSTVRVHTASGSAAEEKRTEEAGQEVACSEASGAPVDAAPTTMTRSIAAPSGPVDTVIPTSVVHQVLRALESPHGDAEIPLTDPLDWDTEALIHYITVMEQRPAEVVADAPRETWSTMDETMTEAFRMAGATGDTLLNVVVPPRLFRLMRRWHVRRQDVVNRAWRQYRESLDASGAGGDRPAGEAMEIPADTVAAAVAQSRGRLDEAVGTLDRTLIQETVLLCFPYGR